MKKTKNGFGSNRIDFHKHKQELESHISIWMNAILYFKAPLYVNFYRTKHEQDHIHDTYIGFITSTRQIIVYWVPIKSCAYRHNIEYIGYEWKGQIAK